MELFGVLKNCVKKASYLLLCLTCKDFNIVHDSETHFLLKELKRHIDRVEARNKVYKEKKFTLTKGLESWVEICGVQTSVYSVTRYSAIRGMVHYNGSGC